MLKKLVLVLLAALLTASLASCGTDSISGETASPNISAEISSAAVQTAQAVIAQPAVSATESPAEPPGETAEPIPTPPASVIETPGPGKAVIVFTFDDGDISDYLYAYPILKEYGIKGTSYIITKFVDSGVKSKMTWEQIKEMAEYGWVIGAHTRGHNALTGLSSKEIKKDCESVNESFKAQGLTAPEIMSYPYGSYNSRVIKAIKPFYKQARLAFYRNDFVDLDGSPYKIACISADMRSKSKLKKAEKLVDKACKKGAVIVFRVHALYKEHPWDTVKRAHILSGCPPQTSSKLFAKLVKYCVDKGCGFMTMTELMDYMEGQQAVKK